MSPRRRSSRKPKRSGKSGRSGFKFPNPAKALGSWFKKLTRPFWKHKARWIFLLIILTAGWFFTSFKDLRPLSGQFETSVRSAVREIPGAQILDKSSLPKENWSKKWFETRLLVEAPRSTSAAKVLERIKKKVPKKFSLYREVMTETGRSNFARAEYRASNISMAFIQVTSRKSSVSTEFLEKEKEIVKPKKTFMEVFTQPRPKIRQVPIAPIRKPSQTPEIVFVIDDVGNSSSLFSSLFSLPRSITIAVLPELKLSRQAALLGRQNNYEVILHQPVEATHHNDTLGPGGIFISQSPDEITTLVGRHLDSLPGVSGSNNHMGSRGTQDLTLMKAYLRALKQRGFFFLDSWTAQGTVGREAAQAVGVPFLKRSVFLDNVDSPGPIRQQVYQLIAQAKREGRAIAIGHVRKNTLDVIREMIPEIERQGIKIVHLRDLL